MHYAYRIHEMEADRWHHSMNSFFLTPLNYFDSDVSMDSMNAILLTTPATPGEPFEYIDYGVEPVQCIPDDIPPFEYRGLKAFNLDGKEAQPATIKQLRNEAELYHRIDVEL